MKMDKDHPAIYMSHSSHSSHSSHLSHLAQEPGTVILDTQKSTREGRGARLFHHPAQILQARQPSEVREVLSEAQALIAGGRCVLAGYIAYEAAGAFGLRTHPPLGSLPLVWFGVYPRPQRIRNYVVQALACPHDPRARRIREEEWPEVSENPWAEIRNGSFNVTGEEYMGAVDRVREYIAAGDTYQVNLACKYRFDLAAIAPFEFYCLIRRGHPVPYGAYLNLGDVQVLSFSPELFLRRRGNVLLTRPMKGTAPRGRSWAEDERLRRELHASPKNRAENVMIVDLMRNDLGRVCEIGSIAVPRLFECERYGSVHQMTSTITGRVRPDVGIPEILAAAFPCGSITGAPKHRTMQIIAEMENEPRGIYCGAIGLLGPGPDLTLNVAIRTIVHRAGKCELGIGSGITWGSEAASEWLETQTKSRFLTARPAEFHLIETLLLRLDPAGRPEYAYLREHLRRLSQSARYWGFRFPRGKVQAALDETARRWSEERLAAGDRSGALIVRLTLDRKGAAAAGARPFLPVSKPVRILLRPERLDSRDPFLYHKTSRRALYDRALAEARKAGYVEALFRNEEGRLTEGCFTNLFVEIGGQWLTPPVEDGLLPGLWRAQFLKARGAVERSLTAEDLDRAGRVVIGNSVRGEIEVDEVVKEPEE